MSIYKSGTIINNRYGVVQGPKEKPSLAGGMGLVYLCVDRAEDGKPVALKTFRPELLSDRAARDRFLREGTTWVELGKHPHIVHFYQVFKANVGSEVFFALELVAAAEGKKDASLRSWLIPNKPLPLEQALLFALHICRGMVHATTKIPGIVHRDLKPENILIGRDGRARVTDFGLASAAQNLGSNWQIDGDKSSSHLRTQLTYGIAGTPMYMAPEQWKGEPLDERADIYAFGCILYEMLCGFFAVTGNSVEELKQAHCQGQLNPIPSSMPSFLNQLLRRCLDSAAADCYHDWTELGTELANVYAKITGEPESVSLSQEQDFLTNQIAIGWSYCAIGVAYQDIGKFVVARGYFEQVITIARRHGHRELESAALGNLGTAYADLGDARHSIKLQEQRLAIAREIGDRHGEGQALGNIGTAYVQLGDAHRAIEFFTKHLVIAREIRDRRDESAALGNLGSAYLHLGDFPRSKKFYEKQLVVARQISDRHSEAAALGNLGIVSFQLGDAPAAIGFYKQSLATARIFGDRRSEGIALGGLGNAYCKLGDVHRAIELYKQSLAVVQEIGDRHSEGQVLGGLGIAYFQLGDTNRAIEFSKQWLALAREIGDRHGEGQALGNLGSTYIQLGDNHRAIEFFEQRLAIARDIEDIIGISDTSFKLALLYYNDKPSTALKYARDAHQLFTQMGHETYAVRAQALINKLNG